MESIILTNKIFCSNIARDYNFIYYLFVVVPDILCSILHVAMTLGVYKTVEISHPQFSLLFQNHVVSLVVSLVNFGLHVFHSWIECFDKFYFLINFVSVQFHFVTWMLVAILRFTLLGGVNNVVDMANIRSKTTFGSWGAFIIEWVSIVLSGWCWRNCVVWKDATSLTNILTLNYYIWSFLPLAIGGTFYVLLVMKKRNAIAPSSSLELSNENEVRIQNT